MRHDETPYHAKAQRPARFAAGADTQRDRQRGHQRRHGRHHDRAKPKQAALINRIERLSPLPLRLDREINHHNRVLFHNTDEHDEANERVDIQVDAEEHQRHQRPEPGRRQSGQDCDRMNETFVKNSQNEVDDQD